MREMPDANELIATAMLLPLSQRVAVAKAMLNSIDSATDADASQDQVAAAWQTEIGRRIDDIDNGRVKTIPSSEVWKRIGGKPSDQT